MNTILITLLSLAWILIIAILLPLIRNDFWVFRIFEYPRYQKMVLSILVLIGLVVAGDFHNTWVIVTVVVLAAGIGYLAFNVWPYTILSPREMKTVRSTEPSNQLKLLTANVFQDNDQYHKLVRLVKHADPDVILLLETDDRWKNGLADLQKDYPHQLLEPLDNTYGLLFFSRLPITAGGIQYLVEDDVPSVEATVQLPSGQLVKIWGLHPKPPVPGEDDRSTAKDKELMKVAFKAEKEELPTIVLGDLNDVAWSYVTKLFRKTSGLLDPRRGRGFFSTFSANHWWMRFPLDYVFCSADFGLVKMERLPHFGSDHFPMFSHFEFQPALENQQEKPEADAGEREEAKKKATQQVK